MSALLFIPAGSLKFWQGWVFVAVFSGAMLFITVYFYKRDRQFLERRMRLKEKSGEQRLFRIMWIPLWACAFVLAGLDYRFGWSDRFLGSAPLWLTLLSDAALLCSFWIVFQAFKANSFASSVIQVETGQKVIATGPYGIVRHPMYSGVLLMIVFFPFALGSYFALPVSLLLIPILVFRLVNEEKMLQRELPGYSGYCRRTRFRLIPYIFVFAALFSLAPQHFERAFIENAGTRQPTGESREHSRS